MLEFSFARRTFRAFRHRDFRLMWLGACASTIGTFVQQFAQSWLVYDLTKDPFYLGLDLFLGQLPIILLSLVGGVFADRMDRRKMLLGSQYIQMICAFALAALFFTHRVRIWEILSLSFIVGLGQSFGGPAYSALSYLAVIASLMMIQVRFVPQKSKEAILKSMRAGIGFIRQREGLSALVLLAFFTTLLGFSLTAFLPVIVQTVFHGGPRTYQLLLMSSGAGSIVGALIVAASEKLKEHGYVVLWTLSGLGVAIAGVRLQQMASRFLPSDLPQWRSTYRVGFVDAVARAAYRVTPNARESHERL